MFRIGWVEADNGEYDQRKRHYRTEITWSNGKREIKQRETMEYLIVEFWSCIKKLLKFKPEGPKYFNRSRK